MSISTEQLKQRMATAFLPGRRRETFALLLLFLFLPLVETVRNAGSTIFVLLVLLSLPGFWSGWRTMEREDKRVFQAILLLLLICLVSLVHTSDWSEAGRRFSRLLRLIFVIPVFIYLRQLDRTHLQAVIQWGIAIAGVVMAGVAAYQIVQAGSQWWIAPEGAYLHILFGEYAAIVFVIGFVFLVFGESPRRLQLALAVGTIASFATTVASMARSAWIALPPVLLILAWDFWRRARDRRRARWALAIAVIAIIVAMAGLSRVYRIQKIADATVTDLTSYFDGGDRNTSLGTRLMLWKNAYVIWKRSPVLGTGLGDYRIDNRDIIRSGTTDLDWGYGEAHNIYMEFLATTGLLGVLALVAAICLMPIRYFVRRWRSVKSRNERAIALGGLMVPVCFSIFGIGQTWTAHQPAITTYALLLAMFMALSREGTKNGKAAPAQGIGMVRGESQP